MSDPTDSKVPERIKGCPFCGHEPLLNCTVSGWKYECINAGCQVNPTTILHTNAKNAAATWDSRPTMAPQQAAKLLLEYVDVKKAKGLGRILPIGVQNWLKALSEGDPTPNKPTLVGTGVQKGLSKTNNPKGDK